LLAASIPAAGSPIDSMPKGQKPIAPRSPKAYSALAAASTLRSASGMKSGFPPRTYRRVHSTKLG
jgi:hypothetical protein